MQTLWFDHPNCITFSRSGTDEDPGCVVVIPNGDGGEKTLTLGENCGSKCWRDFLGNREEIAEIDAEGSAISTCNGGGVGVQMMGAVLQSTGDVPGGPERARRNLSARKPAR